MIGDFWAEIGDCWAEIGYFWAKIGNFWAKFGIFFSTLFHIWVLSVENVGFDTKNLSEFYQGQFEGFFTIF